MGWLKLPIGIILSVVLSFGLYQIAVDKSKTIFSKVPIFQIIGCFVILLLWVLFSGAGGFGYQNHDYYKHNSLLKDLSIQNWPVTYKLANGTKYLSHYLAYYLPGPGLFYTLGWKWVNLANFSLTIFGVLLSFFWVLRFVGKYSFWIVLLFIFGSGAHIFILVYTHGFHLKELIFDNIQNHKYLFWLNCLTINNEPINTINFMSISDMLYWGPQHAIGAWLGVGLLLNDWQDKNINYAPFYISLVAFWAPLVLIGLAPFLLYILLKQRFKGVFNIVNLVIAPIVFGVIAIFLTSIKTTELINHFLFHNRQSLGVSLFQQIAAYLYFIIVEVLIWWLPAYFVLMKTALKKHKTLFWLVLSLLIFIPLFRYGQWNDWCTRASLPALLMLYAMMAMAISHAKSIKTKLYLAIIPLVCSLSPLILIFSSLKYNGY